MLFRSACPLCARETDKDFRKDRQHHLDMYKIMKVFDADKIEQLDKMFMCGNYGDPAASSESKSILSYVRSVNSSIVLGMNTNGGMQARYWWADLANILYKPRDYVVFSIDGLEDTNHIYRRKVNWDRVMENAETFIAAGGNAHWEDRKSTRLNSSHT